MRDDLHICNSSQQEIPESEVAPTFIKEPGEHLWAVLFIYTSEMWVTKSKHKSYKT